MFLDKLGLTKRAEVKMKTSHITGGKVTEPKVKSYGGRPLHVDMESYKKSGIL